jgi:hypothetical protein
MRDQAMPDDELDLHPHEFGVAFVMAATWYFAGPWGMLPTLWFLYVIAKTKPTWLRSTGKLLPVAARKALSARTKALQGTWQRATAPWREPAAVPALAAPAQEQVMVDGEGTNPSLTAITLAELAAVDNILIVGNRGTGKTTLLHAIISARRQQVFVFDPHNAPNKWPAASLVLGGARNFRKITVQLTSALRRLQSRAEQLERGEQREGTFTPFTIAADEWSSIVHECDRLLPRDTTSTGETILTLLREGRKFGMSFIGGAHGDTAASLGSKGDTVAFRQSFDWIVYTGGFVRTRIERDYPTLFASLPLGRNREGGTFPLQVIAWSPTTGEQRLLDLRGLSVADTAIPIPVQAPATTDTTAFLADLHTSTPDVPPPDDDEASTLETTPTPADTRIDTELITALIQAGWSANRIYSKIGGSRNKVMEVIRELKASQGGMDTV